MVVSFYSFFTFRPEIFEFRYASSIDMILFRDTTIVVKNEIFQCYCSATYAG